MKADEQRAGTRTGRRILNGMAFYNYFADKYDLLNHCWARFAASMEPRDFEGTRDGFHTLFDRFADLFDRNAELMRKIFAHNGLDGALMRSLTAYFIARMRESFRANHCYHLEVAGGLPQDLLADFCANTMLLIMRWTFLSATPISRDQAHALIDQLIINTETSGTATTKQ